MKHLSVVTTAVMLLATSLAGCASETSSSDTSGGVQVNLIVGNTDVTAVGFDVACDSGITLSGQFNVYDEQDPPVWAAIMVLPAGDCSITLTAFDDASNPVCTGSADFTVVANDTVKVNIVLTCDGDGVDPLGNVDIDATFEEVPGNNCPRLHFLNVVPDEVPPEGSAVTVLVSDADGDMVTTELLATSGSFADPFAQLTTYTCGGANGTQTITVMAKDGDPACDMPKSFEVDCGATQCVTIPDCKLVWADEFDGDEVDLTKWEFQIGNGDEFGIPGWGNQELQYYTANNATVANGELTIQARQEFAFGYNYTSSRMRTLGLGDWTYGRFEMRARLPVTQGMWPAFWMLSSVPDYGDYAATGEIDIMESRGSNPEQIFGTLHYGGPSPDVVSTGANTFLPPGTATDFHVYAVEWKAGQIRWYVDGQLYSEQFGWFSTGGVYPAPFDVDFHLLLNLAVGGTFGGNPDSTTVLPQDYVIDYVRVYQQALAGTPGTQLVFDNMEHGNPFGNDWFIFDGASSSGTIGSNTADLPPGVGGAFSLDASFGPGGSFLGGFGRGTARDLSGTIEFSFWINPDANQSYIIEVNLQDDDTGDGEFTPGLDDEFQFNCAVSPSGPCAIAGGGWQKVTIPLTHFYDDNTFSNGGNGTLDVNGGSQGLLTGVVIAITGADSSASFRTDEWVFDGPSE